MRQGDLDLLEALTRNAGLPGRPTYRQLTGTGELNRHYVVEPDGAAPMVARLYGWPFPVPEPFDRMTKEAWVLRALAGSSPVVPEVFATATTDTGRGLLISLLPGDVFGETADALPDRTWLSVLDALRAVHDVTVPGLARAGDITGEGVTPYDGGWGAEQARQFQFQADQLAAARAELRPGLDRATRLVAAAVPVLNQRPVGVMHGDAHPWNMLVAPNGTTWHCTGILDWEFARAGDGLVDVVRLDIGRARPLGPPPVDLYTAYGDHSARVATRIYHLAFHVWMANDSRHFDHRPSYDNAERYLRALDSHLDRLADTLDGAG